MPMTRQEMLNELEVLGVAPQQVRVASNNQLSALLVHQREHQVVLGILAGTIPGDNVIERLEACKDELEASIDVRYADLAWLARAIRNEA